MSHIAFPLSVDSRGRTAACVDGDYVRMLIGQLILTSPGERVMRPDFGSGLRQIVFGGNDPAIAVAVELGLQGALNQWLGELIEAERVEVVSDDAALRVTISYLLRGDGSRETTTIERPLA
jgi:uncharacterized protein